MSFEKSSDIKSKFVVLVLVLGCIYFAYHLIQGNRGLLSWMNLSDEITRTQKLLDEAEQEKSTLEKNVKLLSPNTLDLDLLEEQNRKVLGLTYPGEMIFLKDKKEANK